ncbi:MAG: ornithine cyclodeaminase [Planctomycetota bacterium]|nr:ornithine cyclodeaminase [Planctomycetota bacterium]
MNLLILSERDLREALPMRDAVAAMKEAFGALSAGDAVAPQRIHLSVEDQGAVSFLMGAYVPSMGLATKVVSVFPRNERAGRPVVTGLVEVLDPETGEPDALIDGTALTAWRTGAASGAATDLLAREDASVGALIGCGAQGRTQLLAIDAVRDLTEVRVAARSLDSAERFCRGMQDQVQPRLIPVASAAEAVRGADVICAATTSRTPVLDGADLKEGAHLNGVGSFTLDMLELDPRSIERSTIFVDDVEAALGEAGELVAAERDGLTARDRWTPLGAVARGAATGRSREDEITLFKSVGHAVQDVAAASRALARARELGLGLSVDL